MLSPARLLPAAGGALLCVVLALSYASAQTPPAEPTIDSVTSGDTTLTVAWTAPAGATGITAYDVRHIETSADETDDANWTVEDNAWTSGAILQHTITGLTNGTEYDVQVRAVNSHGDGTWSATEVGTPALPAPTIDSVRADDRAVLVSWSAPTGITTGVAAYNVRYIETSADETMDANWTVEENAWEEGGGSFAYAVTGLTNGTEYDLQVRAVDEDDVDGAWSATTSATPADHGDTRAAATSVTAGANVWGAIDPADDEDYFSFSVSSTADYWIYTLGDLDTVGELLDSDGMSIESNDRGGVLPNPDNFFLWHRLQSGTYYLKVTGYGSTDEPYILRVREFTDTTSRSNAATLAIDGFASGTIDPKDDEDYFKLELSETTEVAIRTSGFPDTVGELHDSDSMVIASNDDGELLSNKTDFLIRENLSAGVYYVKVSSFNGESGGPYTVYATAITEPGSAIAYAQPLTLGGTAGGNIHPVGDEDYFSLTLDEPAYVIIGAASENLSTAGTLLDASSNPVQGHIIDESHGFSMQFSLNAGTYYVKVAAYWPLLDTGRYTIRATEDPRQNPFRDSCSNLPRRAGISDPLYGCQWHLNNYDQFSRGAGQDIGVEEVWPTYTGSGINVALVDDGMHYQHEDLTDNVLTAFNHNYVPGQTDIYHPFENHGTAVAGLIAAKDNSLGMRGVAPGAKIYGYNLLERLTAANAANAMSRNAATTAISNNSWGSTDNGLPGHANEVWEIAVKDGVTNGYGGKGVFYAWAAGNGGKEDYATLDEYTSYYAVTAVCAVGHDDKRSAYSELGANLWVCGPSSSVSEPSSSGRGRQPALATTDNGHSYRSSFGGTSAATPIVAGVAALIREANNALTWRDVKLILAASARKVAPNNSDWKQGGFKYGSTTDRYNFNHKYGFGMVDAKDATDLAPGWTNVRDLREITSESSVINLGIPDRVRPPIGNDRPPVTVSTSLNVGPYVDFVEFVEVNAHFNHGSFRDLTVELVSPSGAVSTLTRHTTDPRAGSLTTEFRFGSARHLGEDPAGEWTLRITDHLNGGSGGVLKSWGITIYGHNGAIPGPPEIDTVTPGGGTLVVNWSAPTDTGETAITSYDLRYIREDATDKSDGQWSEVTDVGTLSNRSYTITGLSGGVMYEIQLRAHNDSGHGPWSQVEADEPTVVAPAAPAITSISRGDSTLAVVWTAPADTTGGGVITAYDVRNIETSEDETDDANWTVQDNAWESGDLQYTVTGLTDATQYDVQVRAVNSAGDGAWSGTETGTPRPDTPITLQWEETSIEVAEDAGSVVLRAIFTTTLNTSPETDFTFDVTLTTTDTGTTQDDDYTAPPSSATFVASDFSQTDVNGEQLYRATRDFTVAIFDDTADESNESFSVRLAYLTPGLPHLQGDPATAVVTIQDNEHVPVTLSWEQSDLTVDENVGSATLRAYAITTVDKPPKDGFAFDAAIRTSDGSAAQPDDYTQVDDTVTFNRDDFSQTDVGGGQFRYQATKDISVSIIDDTVNEPDEDFTVTLSYSNPSLPHLQGDPATATVTIADNDHVPVTISWDQLVVGVDEDATTVPLQAQATTTLDRMPESDFTVALSATTADGTATQGEDYGMLTSSSFSFGQSDFTRVEVGGQSLFQATKDISVSIIDDTVDEPDEGFTVTLSYSDPSLPHLQGGPATATVTIADNDFVPVTISWDQPDLTDGEDATTVSLQAQATTRSDRMPESDFTVPLSATTADGTATQGEDYGMLTSSFSFSQSDFTLTDVGGQFFFQATKDISVSIIDDTVDEPDEDFTVILNYSDPSLPHLQGDPATATVTIVDNDFVPVTISWDQSVVSVNEDATMVTLQARATTRSDRMPESGFTVPLSATTADGSATQPDDYTQVDDTVTFGQSDFTRTDVGGGQFGYQATKDISVSIIDDTVDEPDEGFTVTLSYSDPSLPHLQGGPATATVTIADNDFVPVTISWDQPDLTDGEDATTVSLQAQATTRSDRMPESDFTVPLSATTADGTATQGEDYGMLTSSFSFSQSDFTLTDVGGQFFFQATKDISVSIIDDTVDEPDEDFTVTLSYSNPSLPHLQGGPATAVVTIQDNEHVPVTLSWEQSDLTVGENVGSATLRAYATTTLDRMPESDFTVPLSATTADGSATQPDDYTQVDDTVTFGQSDFTRTDVGGGQFLFQATRDISVSIIDDIVDEPDEDFTVILNYSGPSLPHLQGDPDTATVTIVDNDFVPVTISWDQPVVSVDEEATMVTLQARATTRSDRMPESGFTVPLSATTADGSATQPDDYTQVDDTVTFDASDFTRTDVGGQFRFQATRDISVSIIDDTVDEPDEDFTVILNYSGPSLPHLQGDPDTATVTIVDNDFVPVTISWDQPVVSVDEDATMVTLQARATTTLDRMPESGFTVALSATTADGSATQPDDYTQVDDTVTFGQSDFTHVEVGGGQFRYQATRDISVSIIDDTVDEPDEDFTVTLSYSDPSLPHLQGDPDTATVTIVDNDFVPVTISWDQPVVSVDEEATMVTLQARATTMSDRMPESGFTVALSATTADDTATQPDDYTQVDDTVTFGQSDFAHTDVGGGQFRFQATGDISVSISDDTVDEPDEDFTVTLSYSNPSLPHLQGEPATATVTIADNDFVPVTISWDQLVVGVDEDATMVTLQARATTTLDRMPESDFTVPLSATTADGSATQPDDYTQVDDTVTFGQSDFTRTDVGGGQFLFQATRDISVSIIDDIVDEPDEDFTVTLSYSDPSLPHLQGDPATATVTIVDNDHVPVVLSWEQAAVTAEEAAIPGTTRPVSLSAVAVTTKDKMPESGFTFDVTVATADGSATQPADYEQLSGMATFNRSDFTLATISREQRYRAVKPFTVFVTHDTLQELNETFTVTLAYADTGLPYLLVGMDTATVTITDDISSTVDLSTTVSGSPSSVSRGEELTYNYTVSNSGPAASTNTVVKSTLDQGVSFVSATPADKCAHSGGVVTCTFDALNAGASEAGEIVVQVGPAASANIAITSLATSNELDRSPGNDTATAFTELLTPPEQVTNLSPVRSGVAFIELSWSRPSDNGNPITGYELERKEAGESYALVNPEPGVAAITYLDSQLSAGTTYTYQLRAVNAGGEAEWSNEVAAATTRVTPPPPSSSSSSGSGGGGGGGGGGRGRATPTPTPTPSPTPTATPTPIGPQFSGQIAAEPSVTATVVPEGTTLGLNGGADLPGGIYVNFPPTAVALPVHVSVSVSNEAPSDVTAPSGTTLLPLTIDITSDTPLILGEPITIEINPTPEQLAAAGGDLNHLAVGVVTPHGVVVLPTQVMHGRLVVTVDHLSTFTLLAITDPGPVLTQPPMGDASSMGPLLQWTQPPRTTWFQVQVIPFNEDGPGINLVIGDSAQVRAAQYQVLGPNFGSADPNYVMLPGMTYLWRVRTSTVLTNPTEADWSAWAVSSFKTPPASSSTITRVAPPYFGEVRTLTPTLTWANSNTAVFYYEVQVSRDYEFGPNAFLYSEYVHGGASTPANSYVIPEAFPLEAGEIYYWRVRPRIQGDGDLLPWSAINVFLAPG